MADDGAEPDDISSLMEALWGPRSGSPVEDVVPGFPDDDLWGPRRNGSPPAAAGRRSPEPPPAAAESIGGATDESAGEGRAELLRTIEARHVESIELAKADLDAFRAHLDVVLGEIAGTLTGVRDEAVAAADARVGGAETRLLSRLDAIDAAVAHAGQEAAIRQEVLARLAAVEREAAERAAAQERRLEIETQRLTDAFEELHAQSVTPADLDSLRAETGGQVAALNPADDRIAGLSAQLAEATTAMAVIAASVGAAMSRLDDLDQRVSGEMARPVAEVVDPVALRTEVEADVARMIGARDTEMQLAVEHRIQESEAGLAARLTQAVDDLQARSVTPADLDSLRAETVATAASLDRAEAKVDGLAGPLAEATTAVAAIAASMDALTSRLDALDQRVAEELARPAPGVERAVSSETETLTTAQADLSRQLAAVVERLDHLQAAVDGATAQAEADAPTRAGSSDADLVALEARMQAVIDDLAAAVESQRDELKAKSSKARATSTAGDPNARLLQDLEAHARDTDADVAEMHQLHDALDVGLGVLRKEIAELRDMTRKMAGDQAELFDRLESSAPPTAAAAGEKGRGRRGLRRDR